MQSQSAFAKDASELHQDALRAFTEARYEEALRLFKEAYDVTSTPEMLVRIGQTQLKLGRKVEALDACQSYLTLTADRPDDVSRRMPSSVLPKPARAWCRCTNGRSAPPRAAAPANLPSRKRPGQPRRSSRKTIARLRRESTAPLDSSTTPQSADDPSG
jgi:hypothetical protein